MGANDAQMGRGQAATPTWADFRSDFEEVRLGVAVARVCESTFCDRDGYMRPGMIEAVWVHIEQDEFTEIIACMRIPNGDESIVLIYWHGGLMHYSFHIVTFTKKGERVADRVIAGTLSDQDTVLQRVATIDEDWIIYIVEGIRSASGQYDPATSRSFHLELLSTGDVMEVED